jgi:hypothetical protein
VERVHGVILEGRRGNSTTYDPGLARGYRRSERLAERTRPSMGLDRWILEEKTGR